MRYLPVFLRLTLISLFLCTGAVISFCANDPVEQAQKWAKEAQEQEAKAKEAKAKLDCDKPKSADKKALVKAIKAAKAAAETAQKWADQAKADAEKAGKVADANPKNEKAKEAKEKAEQAATDAQNAANEAKTAYDNALGESPGMKAAADIENELDKADVTGNSAKKKIVDRLKKKAQSTAEANPCDPEEVKRAVRVELEKIEKEVSGNGEVRPWVEDLGKTLKDNALIFFQSPGQDNLVFIATRTGSLRGATYETQTEPVRPGMMLGLTGTLLPNGPSVNPFSEQQFSQVQAALFEQPELWEQLYVRLGGEFWIGSPSQPGAFSQVSSGTLRSLGLQAILPFGRHLALQTSITKGSIHATAQFPVTVFNPNYGQTQQLEGSAETRISAVQAQLSGRFYFFPPGAVQLFAGAGAQYRHQSSTAPEARLQDVLWVFGTGTSNSKFGVLGEAGLSVQPLRLPLFVELGASMQQLFNEKRNIVIQATLGWKFK